MYFQKDKEWNQVCFLSRVLNRFYYNEEIPFKSFPEDIRGLKQLQHYKVPIEVKKKIKDKLGRELDPVIAKT